MGIRGLMGLCLERQAWCADNVDLVSVARNNPIELLIDFYSFEHFLLKKLWQSLATVYKNPYLKLCGGEYAALDAYVTKLIKDMQSLNIHLVFYIDGAKGSSTLQTQQKLETWKSRHLQDLHRLSDLISVCHGQKDINQLKPDDSVRPVLLEIQFLKSLQECQCEVFQCAAGEADYRIARDLISRPKAFAVVSNDSDFCIMKDARFIPYELFDKGGNLGLGTPSLLTHRPQCLSVGVINSHKVAEMLQLPTHQHLIELSIVVGNDFTGHYMRPLHRNLHIDSRKLDSVAQWVLHTYMVENNPLISSEMQHCPGFREAVHMSRHFYELTMPVSSEVTIKGPLSHFIKVAVEQGRIPANVMAINNNFYWHRMIMEDNTPGHPCVEEALIPLRSIIYRIVLPRNENQVTEWGRTQGNQIDTVSVYSEADRYILTADFIQPHKIFQNLRFFHMVMTHMDRDIQNNFFERYGKKTGFVCYILRYMLVLNSGSNLHIRPGEFLSLLATAFGYAYKKDDFYMSLAIRPSVRCVTLGNWFQDVYRYAYSYLGTLMYICHEFPGPREIFSGSRWTAYFMCHIQHSVSQLSQDNLREIRQERYHIINDKKHIAQCITEGIMELNLR